MKVACLGALWFALVAGVCFPLVMATLPFATPQTLSQTGKGVLAGLQVFGLPAAVAGFLLANRAVAADIVLSFFLGVLVVVLTCILAALFGVLIAGRFHSFQIAAWNVFAVAFGFLLADFIFLRGVPFIAGGLAMLAFRAFALSSKVAK
jgi:hypothetical protein